MPEPGQVQHRRNDQANAFAGPGRREAKDMLRTVLAKVVMAEPAEAIFLADNKWPAIMKTLVR